ncbi:hypothetical protein P692DRAFT_20877833 [Suillus brevipes Sb2]|nr:hypothetical protein P692DRAFT_20877833 [Suillus brevipes Sb2]
MSETPHHVHARIEQENIQTANDTNLCDDDDEMEDESQTRFQFDTPKCVVSQEDSTMDLDVASQPHIASQPHVASQPPTRAALPDRVEKRAANSVLPDKRCIKEVDYSEKLRETVYSQEELIRNMQKQVEEQKNEHEQNMKEMKRQWDTTLRERQEQLATAQEEIERTRVQQLAAEAELCETLAKREEALKRKTNEEAEKESELAKMEQRFSRRPRSQDEDVDMNIPMPGDAGQPSPDGKEVPQQHSSEDNRPLPSQHDTQPATMMEDAIARGVEAALRHVLIDKEFPLTNKHKLSPRRKRVEEKELRQEKAAEKSYEREFILGEVRRLFKDVFSISQDSDFMLHEPASHDDVYAYEYEDGPGPNCNRLAFDLKGGPKSPWNDKVVGLLLEELHRRVNQESWPFRRSEAYFKEVLQERYKRLRTVWIAAQPKVTAKGGLETPAEVEQRLIMKKDESLKVTRQTTRRKNKYSRRATVLDHLVKYKTDENEEDLPAWQWLQKLVMTLGDAGMSSEESDVKNDIEMVLRVKNMTLRRAIEQELDIINHQRMVDDDIFAPQGSKPMKRICSSGNPKTSRTEMDSLPKALYNKEWLAGLTKRQIERLSISDENAVEVQKCDRRVDKSKPRSCGEERG